ncbi:helix-turn-helix domain-containing protein [Arenibacter sp. 6A1]|uniref:two-component regulator propeller domain-containing protein n=1 Tax=Arenibacter sp. 6A1 TaxID=2720391 RepID=UPI0014469E32|nr:two-component regulator propeller domain-containing protein [Arenibacter sp. 6A1]NKI24976.1 helix-turn-helix domain-containing protein [Arenibacter sp. 6A1]
MKQLYLLFIIFPSLFFGQQIKFNTLTTEDGLSNNSILGITSDKNGVLWIGTWDGLNSYDGHSFKIYKHIKDSANSLAGNVVRELVRDANMDIWALTDNKSVSKYIGGNSFQNYRFEKEVGALRLSREGNPLVSLDGSNEHYEFDGDTFVRVEPKNLDNENDAALHRILHKYNPELVINQVMKDRKGNVWFATKYNGVYVLPNKSSNVHSEHIEHYRYDPYSKYSFNSNEVEKLYEDDFGNIWLGHKDGGLSMAYRESEKISLVAPHPIHFPNLPNETIRAITKDQKGDLWLGYYNQGLFKYDQKLQTYVAFEIPEARLNKEWNRIRSLFTSSDGSVWVGTYGGVLRISNNTIHTYTAEKNNLLPNNRNYSFFEDDHHAIWTACWGGLAKFSLKNNRFESFKGQDALQQLQIRKVKVQEQEVLLATENSGLVILDLLTGNIKGIAKADGALGNSIYDVYKDPRTNYYWIASLGGITVYDLNTGVVKNITEKEGLPSHMVYSLLPNKDDIWISTTKGIAAVNRSSYAVLSMNPEEGWQAAEFSEGAYYQDVKGGLYFAGVYGMNYFSPNNINFFKELPKLQVRVDQKSFMGTRIEKSYGENNLSVAITPVSFHKDPNNQVVYKLEGFDHAWEVFESNPIRYSDLPYGDYRLLVKNTLDESSANTVIIPMSITKPFYLSFWFLGTMSGFLLVILGIIILQRNKKALRYRRELERKIQERTQTINSQKEELITANKILDEKHKEISDQKNQLLNTHLHLKKQEFEIESFKTFVLSEFKEPIAKILDLSGKLKEEDAIKNALLMQSGKLTNLLMEWDFLNHVKDIGTSKKSAVKLGPILNQLLDQLNHNAITSNIHLHCTVKLQDNWIAIDVLRFKLLMKYLFFEVIKYGAEESNLTVDVSMEHDRFVMKILSDSDILTKNAHSIQQYSPYFRAVNTLIQTLEGALVFNDKTNQQEIRVSLPALVVAKDAVVQEEIQWRHLKLEEKMLSDKNNIVVFCEESDYLSCRQLLLKEGHNLLFESSVGAVSSLIKKVSVHGMVIYNSPITEELMALLQQAKDKTQLINLPVLYISEQIDYSLQEQTMELGIDAFIQLPARDSFIHKRLQGLIATRKEYLKDQSKYQLFGVAKDESQHLSPNEKLLNKALEIIKNNLESSSFNVQELNEQLQISKIKSYRIFKEVLSKSPSEVITELRMQKAEYLLQSKTLNIAEISFACGFNDPKYFSRIFKKHFGCSPKVYKLKKTA